MKLTLALTLLAACEFSGAPSEAGDGDSTPTVDAAVAADAAAIDAAAIDAAVTPFAFNVIIEAEDAPTVIPRAGRTWLEVSDGNASLNAYVVVDTGDACMNPGELLNCAPELELPFVLPTQQQLFVHVRGFAPTGASDEAYFGINGQALTVLNFNQSQGDYHWMSTSVTTQQPLNTLRLILRETDLRLDALIVTDDPNPPGAGS